MGLVDYLLGPPKAQERYGPLNDFWYEDAGRNSASGVPITVESSLQISTVYACVTAILQDIASMPTLVYQRLPDGRSRQRATNHPLFETLHDNPNDWQTAVEFKEEMFGHALLRGNAYAQIVPGPKGFVDQLVPLNPARMVVKQLANRRVRYEYTLESGEQRVFAMEEIFHIRGFSNDGLVGMSVVSLARNTFGLAKAGEEYGGRFFSQGSEPRGVLEMDGTLDPEGRDRLKSSWEQAHAGLGNSNRVAVLERGTRWKQTGMSNEDSQFLESRRFQVEEIARWFNVPLGRIGHTEKATSWGTGLVESNIWYITYALLPWIRRFEQRANTDLILNRRVFFVEFLMDHLLRGDSAARHSAYHLAISDGWMTRNEVRQRENLNPAEGLDDYLVPQNMAVVNEQGQVVPVSGPAEPPSLPEPPPDQRARLFATELAGIAVRRQAELVRKMGRLDPEKFEAALDEFYAKEPERMSTNLHISIADARRYCERLRDEPDRSEHDKIVELADLALGGMELVGSI